MTVNERIRHIRKEKKLNQKQFASMLGITQSGVSYMEQNGSTVSDSSIKTICSVCGVDEEWLRNGTGEMYVQSNAFSLNEFVKQNGGSEMDLEILKTYFELDTDTRQALFKFFKSSLRSSGEATTEELEEEYKKNVLNSAPKKDFTVSSTTADITAAEKKAANEN